MSKQPARRKRNKTHVSDSFYIPVGLSEAIANAANRMFGGNKSALVTEKLADALGVEVEEQEVAVEKR